jgi:hypothetical protein
LKNVVTLHASSVLLLDCDQILFDAVASVIADRTDPTTAKTIVVDNNDRAVSADCMLKMMIML